jgi:hypothetical protein
MDRRDLAGARHRRQRPLIWVSRPGARTAEPTGSCASRRIRVGIEWQGMCEVLVQQQLGGFCDHSTRESPLKTGSYSLTSAEYLFNNNLAFLWPRSVIDRSVIDRSVIDRSVIDRSVIDRSVIDRSVIDRSVIDRSVIDQSAPDAPSKTGSCFLTSAKKIRNRTNEKKNGNS